MSAGTAASKRGASSRSEDQTNARKKQRERERRNAEKRKALKLVSWNVNSFAPRAMDVDTLFKHEDIDILFACETKKQQWASGAMQQLDFEGSIISM